MSKQTEKDPLLGCGCLGALFYIPLKVLFGISDKYK